MRPSISSRSSESLSISPLTRSPHVDEISERTLIDPIPSPPIATWNLNRKMHILSLPHAVSFGKFVEISDTKLCHSAASNASLSTISVYSSVVEQFDTKKHSAQFEGYNPNIQTLSLSLNKAMVLIRRLFSKPRQDQSSWTYGNTTRILGVFLPNGRVTYCEGKSKSNEHSHQNCYCIKSTLAVFKIFEYLAKAEYGWMDIKCYRMRTFGEWDKCDL